MNSGIRPLSDMLVNPFSPNPKVLLLINGLSVFECVHTRFIIGS